MITIRVRVSDSLISIKTACVMWQVFMMEVQTTGMSRLL